MSWSPASGSTQDKYIVTYTGASDAGSDTDEVLSTTTSKTYDLFAGYQYTFSVRAVSGSEESADSNEITKSTCKLFSKSVRYSALVENIYYYPP